MMQIAKTALQRATECVDQGRTCFSWLVLVLVLVLFAGCSFSPLTAGPPATVPPKATPIPTATLTPSPTSAPIATTPTYTPAQPLLAKVVAVGPVYVTGDSTVPDEALRAAGLILAATLQHRPDVGARLRQAGVITAVASRNEKICDLPYFAQFDATLCQSYGEGGAGGTPDLPVTACDERNLLKEPDDPYERGQGAYSQDICVHELAHTIMNIGLTQADRNRIHARFLAEQQANLWTGDYAMTDDMEFWAVMSQFYFSAGPSATYTPSFHHIANGPEQLKRYDPATFALLNSIYDGSTDLS